jgi:hypothetical protein
MIIIQEQASFNKDVEFFLVEEDVMNIYYTTSHNRTLGYLIPFEFQALSSKRHHSLWKVVLYIYIYIYIYIYLDLGEGIYIDM